MNNQNESPFGSPRFLAALAITFFGLWGWQYYISKNYSKPHENQPTAQPVSETKSEVAQTQVNQSSTQLKDVDAPANQNVLSEVLTHYSDDNVSFDVSSKDMGIKNFTLKNYKDRAGEPISFSTEFSQAGIKFQNQSVDFSINKMSDFEFVGTANFNGKNVKRILKYNKDLGFFNSTIEFEPGIESIQTAMYQKHFIPKNTNFLMPSFELQDFIFIENGKTQDQNISSLKENEGFLKTALAPSLVSVGTQYFSVAAVNKSEVIPTVTNKVEKNMASIEVNFDLKNSNVKSLSQIIYLGPKKSDVLLAIDPTLPEVMNYGMFGFISKILMKIMISLHGFLGNWGLAIIALTLIVRTILLPFNVISFRSAQAMQKIKPKMDAIRERYKDDPLRMNKETMALMKDQSANPLMGCLPMLIQIPIFFALWRAIGSSIEIYQQPFFGWIHDLSYHDPMFVFPILMGITMYLQQKLTPTTMDPTQAKILNFMPILFTLFMLTLPSGLTLYNFISSLFGVTQQFFLLRDNKAKDTQLA